LGGAGSYFFLNGEKTLKGPFEATKEDYQKVYDEIAARLADYTDYDDGSYGPVLFLSLVASSYPLILS
jgi:cytochrome c peroxidase